jgi:O-antigen/teichoic acid export membrane protein
MQIVLKTINTILIADQKPAKSAFFDMLGQVLVLLIIFILTKTTSGSLLYLSLALGVTPILILLTSSFWFYNHEYKKYRPLIRMFERNIVKDILSLGSKFFMLQIAAIAIYQTTNIIIVQISNPESVTIYNVAYKYFSVALMISNIILTPFWSAFTDAHTQKDYAWMKNSYKKLSKIIVCVCIFVLLLFVISPFAYKLWIGNQVLIPVSISFIVALYMISNIICGLQSQVLNGVGKIKLQLILANISIFVNIPLAIFLGKALGLIGVVLPILILNLIGIIIYSIQVKRILNNRAKGIWNK